jgi:hypothetical protein
MKTRKELTLALHKKAMFLRWERQWFGKSESEKMFLDEPVVQVVIFAQRLELNE